MLEQEDQEGFHMTVTVLHVVFHSLALGIVAHSVCLYVSACVSECTHGSVVCVTGMISQA